MTEETVNEIQWTIHQTHPDMVKSARDKLAEVVDPEIGMNIIQLGLVRDISIENDIARMKMILTTPFCPYAGSMIAQVKEQTETVVDHDVKVTLLAERWDPRDAGLMW
jgi:metal-sulfur cluster biosynthetic enzyme